MKILMIFFAAYSFSVMACDMNGNFFPKNNLYIPESVKSSGISEQRFNSIIDEFEMIYSPIFKKRGSNFKINKNWKSPTVNARAYRKKFTRYVTMYGGMARHPEMTELGFALVICHEIGHHLGGAPLADPFMSGEGQSDYYASTKCMRRYLRNKSKNIFDNNSFARDKCATVYKNESDIEHCVLTAEGGIALSRIFAQLNEDQMPKLETPDLNIARRTNHRHAGSQCRLDTYFAGALCDNDIELDFSTSDTSIGGCHPINSDQIGFRPTCWFKNDK